MSNERDLAADTVTVTVSRALVDACREAKAAHEQDIPISCDSSRPCPLCRAKAAAQHALADAVLAAAVEEGECVRYEIHSVVVTGNEPHGGVTMVCDRGEARPPRYICVEVPEIHLGSLVEALAASRKPTQVEEVEEPDTEGDDLPPDSGRDWLGTMTIEVDEDEPERGPFWTGMLAGSMDGDTFDSNQPLILDPRAFPIGTTVVATAPHGADEKHIAARPQPDPGLGGVTLNPTGKCACEECRSARAPGPLDLADFRYACEVCGNKRCPHHRDHRFECTRSNEPDQIGTYAT